MSFSPGFRASETPAEKIYELACAGFSKTRCARELHISPTRFARRLANQPDLARAFDSGQTVHRSRVADRSKPRKSHCEDPEFNTTVPLQPLDEIIENAIIAQSVVDRAAIEKLLNPHRSRRVQIMPALERLIQHGRIKEVPSRDIVTNTHPPDP